MRIGVRRIPLLVATVLLLSIGFASATGTAPMTTNTIQELNGQIFKITDAFSFIVSGFHAAGSDAAASSACNWVVNSVCNTAEISGDWVYEVVLQLNAAPSTTTAYTILVHMNQVSNSIVVSVPSGASTGSGAAMAFDFDTGVATMTSPLVFVIEVY